MNGSAIAGGVRLVPDTWCELRDGVRLATDLYYPPEGAGGPFPVLLLRTPYGKFAAQAADVNTYAHPIWYAQHGYMVAVQDVRGRHASEGDWNAFRQEGPDGHDAVEWCASLDGSTGAVGMYGMSYGGYAQLAAASHDPPSLKCVTPACITPNFTEAFMWRGLPRTALIVSWGAAVAADQAMRAGDVSDWNRLLEVARNPSQLYASMPLLEQSEIGLITRYLPFIREWLLRDEDASPRSEDIAPPQVPALYLTGWYDTWVRELIDLCRRADSRAATTRLLVGPWAHAPWRQPLQAGCRTIEGREPRPSVNALHLEWFDWQLKNQRPTSWLSEHSDCWYDYGANEWRAGDLGRSGRVAAYVLASNGLATVSDGGRLMPLESEEVPDGTSVDVLVDNPLAPTHSVGGWGCCYEAVAPIGPKDQAGIEALAQVATYTSRELGAVVVEGAPSLQLDLILEKKPSTVIATLCLLRGGQSINISRGMTRVRTGAADATAGGSWSQVAVTIELTPLAVTLRETDRIRLNVHASAFPEIAPDPHVEGSVATMHASEVQSARIGILPGPGSVLRLPIGGAELRASVTHIDTASEHEHRTDA